MSPSAGRRVTPERFGKGAIEGVAAPEAANNASATGAMVPLLTLGIPASGTAAVMLAALILNDVRPGPRLFETNPDLVWGLIASMYIGNVMLLILNLPLIGIWVRLIRIRYEILGPATLFFAFIGVYAAETNIFEVYVMIIVGRDRLSPAQAALPRRPAHPRPGARPSVGRAAAAEPDALARRPDHSDHAADLGRHHRAGRDQPAAAVGSRVARGAGQPRTEPGSRIPDNRLLHARRGDACCPPSRSSVVYCEVAEILPLGHTPYGERRIINILGGRVEGPRLNGRILTGGADWQIIRTDGVADLKARYTIETEAGARILVTSDGLRHGPPEVIARLARGETVDPSLYYFRTAMRFETADPDIAWLNKIIALGRGIREALAVRLDVFEVL